MVYSMDLRERVVRAVGEGRAIAEVARTFGVQRGTVRNWRDRASSGELEPGKPGPKGHVKLTDADVALLRAEVAERSDQTLAELRAKLSVTVVESTVSRALEKQGLSLKKNR